ncbi:hypothetical protein QBC39DRAFT_336252 [Podospora conica]|nr:hypothetical protein QBC39DRAFT_336252 [Schizothecium conicum]
MNMKASDISPPAGDAKYTVEIVMAPHSPYDTDTPPPNACDVVQWGVSVKLNVDLGLIQKGLFWTTQNLVLLAGHLQRAKANEGWPCTENTIRVWQLREFPGRPKAESRWSGQISLWAHSPQTLVGFRLGQLTRQLIRDVRVTDHAGNVVFRFASENPAEGMDDILDVDPQDLWWLWPMESIIPREEGQSSSRPHRCVTEARTSWADLPVLLCAGLAGLAGRLRGVEWPSWDDFVDRTARALWGVGSFVLLASVVLGNSSVTEARTSWTDLAVLFCTGLAGLAGLPGRLRRVEWPSWNNFIDRTLTVLWGVGSFVLLASVVLFNSSGLIDSFRAVELQDLERFVSLMDRSVWGIGRFALLAMLVYNSPDLLHRLLMAKWAPAWGDALVAIGLVWGIGLFILFAYWRVFQM